MLRFPSFWCFLRVPICFCASTLNVSLFQPCGWRGRPPSYVPRGAVPWGVNEGAVPRCDLQCVWVSVHLFPPIFPTSLCWFVYYLGPFPFSPSGFRFGCGNPQVSIGHGAHHSVLAHFVCACRRCWMKSHTVIEH